MRPIAPRIPGAEEVVGAVVSEVQQEFADCSTREERDAAYAARKKELEGGA